MIRCVDDDDDDDVVVVVVDDDQWWCRRRQPQRRSRDDGDVDDDDDDDDDGDQFPAFPQTQPLSGVLGPFWLYNSLGTLYKDEGRMSISGDSSSCDGDSL